MFVSESSLSLSLSLISFNSVRAETTLSVSTPSDPILEVSLSSNLIQLDLTPSLGAADFKTANLTVTAGTNNITGYTLYMDVDSPDLTRTEAIDNTTPVIASLAENEQGYTEANFTANSWGYRIGSGNFLAIPAGNLTLSSNTSPSNGNSTTVTFASKVDMSQPAGSYSTDVDIVAIANPILELQDVETWEGSITTGQVIKAKDTRDNKYYTVSRLADGRLWFLDNLALDLTDTDVQSNLTAATTNASATSLGYLKNGGGTTSDQYATSGVANWTSGYSYSAPLVNMDSKDVVPDNAPANSAGNNKAGGYYNYCAASAGSYCYGDGTNAGTSSGNATEDICPAGWRIPTSNTGEYGALANIIYGSTGNISDATAAVNYRSALSLPLSGYFYDGSVYRQGDYGYFWSSTRYDDYYTYFLFVDTINVGPSSSYYRYRGNPVRCIAKKDIKVTFNANGGTGTMPVQNLGETGGTLAANTFTNGDMSFTGWNTAADGSGTPYANGATYNGPSTTLYAQWKTYVPGSFERAFADANKTTKTINGVQYFKMQDMTSSICNSVDTSSKINLVDIRDDNIYRITKISDNNCWMTMNINLAGGTLLTSADSNVTRDFTLPASNSGGFNSGNRGTPYVYNDSTYGGYYSYAAATAGINPSTSDSTEDICPKGWKLPTSAIYTSLKDIFSTGNDFAADPWYGTFASSYSNGSISGVGEYAYYWSSTSYDSADAYFFYFEHYSKYIFSGWKSSGMNVRCISK